jgi:PTS system fructose-specific IIA component/PTS system nitrogen regulatory IIA component
MSGARGHRAALLGGEVALGERKKAVKFSDFVCVPAIKADLAAEEKEGVISELVGALIAAGVVSAQEQESIVKAIMKREELGSTGIGRGVAVPHTKHPSVDRLIGTVGVSTDGVDFHSLDGEKVQLFFLLVSPPDRPGDHLRALENISRQLRDDMFCRFLKQAKTPTDIQQLLEESDANQFTS